MNGWPRVRAGAFALLALGAPAGCVVPIAPLHFTRLQPDAPRVSHAPVTVSAEALERANATGLKVVLRVEAEGTQQLLGAALTPTIRPPCGRDGVEAAAMHLDGRTEWARPLPLAGTVRLGLEFPEPEGLLDGPTALDLRWATPGRAPSCQRIEVTGSTPELGWHKASRWSAGASIWFPAAALSGSVGTWFGPLRLGLDGTAWAQGCWPCSGELTVWASPTAELRLATRGGRSLGLKAGYGLGLGASALRAREVQRTSLWQFALRVGDSPRAQPGLPHGPRVADEFWEIHVLVEDNPRGRDFLGLALGFGFDLGL